MPQSPKLQPFYVRVSREHGGLCVVEDATGREVYRCPINNPDCVFTARKRLADEAAAAQSKPPRPD